jgi:hypothetical protein
MIDISVPPGRRHELGSLYKSWLRSRPQSKPHLELVIQGFPDPNGWNKFTLDADESFCAYLIERRFAFRDFEVRR